MDAMLAPDAVRTKLAVRNLNFYYGKYHALKNINLEIPEKKVTAFVLILNISVRLLARRGKH